MKIKNLLLTCALLLICPPVHAIELSTALVLTVGSSFVGAGSGLTLACVFKNNWLDKNGFTVGMVAGGLFGGYFFFRMTPLGRMRRAYMIVKHLQHQLENQNISGAGKGILKMKKMYIKQLDYACSLAMAAEQENAFFMQLAQELYAQIDSLRIVVSTMGDTSKAVQTI